MLVRLWATTPAGLEDLAAAECAECAGWSVERTERGVVQLSVGISRPEELVLVAQRLRMTQRLLAFVLCDTLPTERGREDCLAWMQERACLDGGPALLRLLPLWRAFQGAGAPPLPDDELAFHVRAQRGGKHPFSSDDAKRALALGVGSGSGLRGACRLGHQLALDARVHHEHVWLGLCLFNARHVANAAAEPTAAAEPAPQRELSVTTLNATIAHAMLRALRPRAGSLVVDPMAGCGTLPELGCSAQRERGAPCFFLAGDSSPVAVAKARANLRGVRLVDIILWDATRLPLRTGVVDHFVSDLPFGKRLGSKAANRQLYPQSLEEMRRALCPTPSDVTQPTPRAPVCPPEATTEAATHARDMASHGRPDLVLLSADRHALTTAVRSARARPWRVLLQRRVNVGGLDGLLLGVALAPWAASGEPPQRETELPAARDAQCPGNCLWPGPKTFFGGSAKTSEP